LIITNIYQYQQNKQSPLNSDGQQLQQYQQHEQSPLTSDDQLCFVDYGEIADHHCLEVIVHVVDIGRIVDHHCLEVIIRFADKQ
jgi:hypothetical protein